MHLFDEKINGLDINYLLNNDILDIKYFDETDDLGRFKWGIYIKEKIIDLPAGCVIIAEQRKDDSITFYSEFEKHYIEICEKFNIKIDENTKIEI